MTLTRYNLASVFLFPFWRWLKWEGNKKIKIKNNGGECMLEKKILDEEIKLFRVGNLYRIYGKTFDVREELEKVGAKWNSENKKLEISLNDFEKLSENIKRKVFEVEEKQRQMSLENIAHIIMSGQIKVYLNQDEEYQIYGRTKEIYKDLKSLGFSLNENNYTLRKADFERMFPNEVKEFINEYSNKKSNKTQQEEQKEESVYEEENEEEYRQ